MSNQKTVVNIVRMNPNKRGPVELQLVETCRQWTAAGGRFACWFTDPAPPWYQDMFDEAGGTLGVLNDVSDQKSWDREVLRVASAENADIVHLHFAAATTARTLSRSGRVVILTEHMELSRKRLVPLRRAARFLRQRHVDAFIAVSAFVAAQTVREHLTPRAKVHIIMNGVDLARFRPRPTERSFLRKDLLGLTDDRVVVTMAAHLVPNKRQSMLLGALAEVLHQGSLIFVVIAGGGPDEAPLRQLASDFGLAEHVLVLTGDNDVASLYAASDVGVLVSVREALGGSAVEAMACGIPVVTTRVGGLQEVAEDGVSGILLEDDTPEGLAAALLTLVEDPGRRTSMGAAARARAETTFDLSGAAQSTCALYRRLSG